MALHVDARYVGTGWMIIGLVCTSPTAGARAWTSSSHHRISHRERPAFFIELEYRSALVPIFGADVDASALRTASKLVGEGALVEAIYVLQVPNQLSLDAGLDEEERIGLGVLESAKVTGRKLGLQVSTRLVRTRNPGAAIVEEAIRSQAEIIYLATNHAPPSERSLGPTASYLLSHRPCRVVIETPAVANGVAKPAPRGGRPRLIRRGPSSTVKESRGPGRKPRPCCSDIARPRSTPSRRPRPRVSSTSTRAGSRCFAGCSPAGSSSCSSVPRLARCAASRGPAGRLRSSPPRMAATSIVWPRRCGRPTLASASTPEMRGSALTPCR